jgi:hypothetical protein
VDKEQALAKVRLFETLDRKFLRSLVAVSAVSACKDVEFQMRHGEMAVFDGAPRRSTWANQETSELRSTAP